MRSIFTLITIVAMSVFITGCGDFLNTDKQQVKDQQWRAKRFVEIQRDVDYHKQVAEVYAKRLEEKEIAKAFAYKKQKQLAYQNRHDTPTISMKSLIKTYEENEIAADTKYKDKYIKLSGPINAVKAKHFNYSLYTDDPINTGELWINVPNIEIGANVIGEAEIYAILNPIERDKAMKLSKNQQITVIGRCMKTTLGHLILEDCIIIDK